MKSKQHMTHALPDDVLFMAPPYRQVIPAWRLPGMVFLLYACLVMFYGANTYHGTIAGLLKNAKWLALAGLAAYGSLILSRVRFHLRKGIMPGLAVAFIFIAGTSVYFSENPKHGAFVLVSVIMVMVAARNVALIYSSYEARNLFYGIIANVTRLVVASASIMWLLGMNLGRGTGSGRFSGWTDNPNLLGMMLAPGLVVLLAGVLARERGWKYRYAAFLLPGAFLLQQTGSRAALLWFLVSCVALWVYRKGIGISSFLGIPAMIAVVGWWEEIIGLFLRLAGRPADSYLASAADRDILSGRTEVWQLGWELFWERPLLGHGIDSSARLIEENAWLFTQHQGLEFHNSYLTILVETGILGFSIFAIIIIYALSNAYLRTRTRAARQSIHWSQAGLDWAIILGAFAHAVFETWLHRAGNLNSLLLWTIIWRVYYAGSIIKLPQFIKK